MVGSIWSFNAGRPWARGLPALFDLKSCPERAIFTRAAAVTFLFRQGEVVRERLTSLFSTGWAKTGGGVGYFLRFWRRVQPGDIPVILGRGLPDRWKLTHGNLHTCRNYCALDSRIDLQRPVLFFAARDIFRGDSLLSQVSEARPGAPGTRTLQGSLLTLVKRGDQEACEVL